MPPVAPTRPLWWLARWATRLLTGFAVAAAFTLGAWATSAPGAPAGHPADGLASAALLAQAPHTGWHATSPGEVITPDATVAVDHADPAGVPGLLSEARPEAYRPAVTAVAGPAAPPPTVVPPGAHGARAPPGA
ncbi:hypothetical protein [Micromonospora sp. NPDC049900]|uniref:hypothetical protein n=1 Tax=unclassified Micromonospora TaxID=2617518 RepID=UPI00379434A7